MSPYANVFSNIATDLGAESFVNIKVGERQRALGKGDILFTASSESSDEIGMSSVITQTPREPLYLNSFCAAYRLNDSSVLDPEFAKHLFRSRSMRKQIIRTGMGVTRINLSKARLAKVSFPVPPLAEQLHIARVLDDFYALVNDLSVGLPAELTSRRKQYKYYRDKLLAFKEAR